MKVGFFKKIFNLPNCLSMQVAGIEVCNKSIKYIEFSNSNGDYLIKNFGEIFLPPNTVKDGAILNKSALSKALLDLKKNITADFIKVSIPEEQAYIFDVKIPREAKYNAREVLEFRIEENVPLKLTESSYEFEIVEDDPLQKDITLSVSVVSKKIITGYTDIFDQVGLYPISFGVESIMAANSVIPRGEKKNCIIVDIKEDSTVLVAIINGFVRQTSIFTIGENTIRDTLLKTGLFSDELIIGKYFENDFSFENTYSKESYSSLVNIFSIFKDEIEKFNDYIITRFPSRDNPNTKKSQ